MSRQKTLNPKNPALPELGLRILETSGVVQTRIAPGELASLLGSVDAETLSGIRRLAASSRAALVDSAGITTAEELADAFRGGRYTVYGGINSIITFGPFASQLEKEGIRIDEAGEVEHTRARLNELEFSERNAFYLLMKDMGMPYGGVKRVYIDPQVSVDDLRGWLNREENKVNAYVKNNETLQIERR